MAVSLQNLQSFLDKSPSPWHAIREVESVLLGAGFERLHEKDAWPLVAGKKYFVIRQGTSLCAFIMPAEELFQCKILAAHTDSPGFKLRQKAEFRKENMMMLGLEIYGAPLLSSWLNRDLGIAGRVVAKSDHRIANYLVQLDQNPVVIPQLAIHLDRGVNESGLILNKHEHLSALVGTWKEDEGSFLLPALQEAVQEENILGWDLFLYPLEPARFIGRGKQLLSGYRLDNLCCLYAAVEGLLSASEESGDTLRMAVFWDHEEIGSATAQGAGSPFLPQTIERIAGSREKYFRVIAESLCLSMDAGHAFHPNYPEKHDPRHLSFLNEGILLKNNAQYRYASDACTSHAIADLCQRLNLPLQQFMGRGDIPSGSTIGPVIATLMGIPTVDIGIPLLSMHSCREIIGCEDYRQLCLLLQALFKES